jgi:hypothetical protein
MMTTSDDYRQYAKAADAVAKSVDDESERKAIRKHR